MRFVSPCLIVAWFTRLLPFVWLVLPLNWLSAQTPAHFDHINRDMGLSQSGVYCILRDAQGFMWFGTGNGLDRFDGYHIVSHKPKADDPHALTHPTIMSLYQDGEGRIWIGSSQGNLEFFDPQSGYVQRPPLSKDDLKLLSNKPILALSHTGIGHLAIGTPQGLLVLNTDTNQLQSFEHAETGRVNQLLYSNKILYLATAKGLFTYEAGQASPQKVTGVAENLVSVVQDKDGRLWIGGDGGLFFRNIEGVWVSSPRWDALGLKASIRTLETGRGGVLWVGTNEGVVRLETGSKDISLGTIRYHQHVSDKTSLSYDDVSDIYEDPEGVLWVATWGGGVNRMDLIRERFFHYRHFPDDPTSLPHNMVLSVTGDKRGRVWVGTERGISIFQPGNPGHFQNIEIPGNEDSESPLFVTSMAVGLAQDMWLGTETGLVQMGEDGEILSRFHRANNFPGRRVWSMVSDGTEKLWIGTRENGLVSMSLNRPGEFQASRHDPNEPGSLSCDSISSLFLSKYGHLWVGTSGRGLCLLEEGETPQFVNYIHEPNNPKSISDDVILSMHEDDKGRFWIGTQGGGLNLMEAGDNFRAWRMKDGLPDETIYGILHDARGLLWLSTNNGLVSFDPERSEFHTFQALDGLQSNEFNSGCRYRDAEGRLYFGGINGMTAFFPEDILKNTVPPKAVITLLEIDNRPVSHLDKDAPISKPLHLLDSLTLAPRQRTLTLGFSALSHASPERNRFAFKLEGLHNDWVYRSSPNRLATFAALTPGTYTFRVKAANKQGVWSSDEAQLEVNVKAPFWRSWWVFSFYALVVLVLFFGLLRTQRKKLLYERDMVERLREIDKLKDDFLANTSHELRTPLNGIIGLAESMLDGAAGAVSLRQAAQLTMIASSGRRLSALVNDILDFSKLKHKGLALELQDVDINALTDVVFTLCGPLAADKGLRLINGIPEDTVRVRADEGRLKQVLYNLVGNAIKFTERGEVRVGCQLNEDMWTISVSDTGIGIAPDKQERIFKSFEQVEDSRQRVRGGAGLGLALSRRLINLHGGNIWVDSVVGVGSTFTFSLPRSEDLRDNLQPDGPAPLFQEDESFKGYMGKTGHMAITIPSKNPHSAFHVLIVDDEPVNRQVLINHLSQLHQKVSAVRDGPEALHFLSENQVDLVLLDIMMPGMSGFEVCRKIRASHPVEELPVIFISARHQVEDVLAGFDAGASDFLAKPFPKQELLERVKVHLRLQDARRHLMQAHGELKSAMDELQHKNEELIKAHHKLVLQEKMATIGTLASGVVHELKNPANYTNICAQSLRDDLTAFRAYLLELAGEDPEVVEALDSRMKPLFELLDSVFTGTERLKEIALNLSGFSRMGRGELRFSAISDCLTSTLALVKAKFKSIVTFHVDIDEPLETVCRPAELSQVFMNILVNACQAISEMEMSKEIRDKGNLWIRTYKEDGVGFISFRDTGGGVPKDIAPNIFEAFFTTKPEGEGTGLGLSISRQIMEEHEGDLHLETERGVGSTFTVIIPIKSADTLQDEDDL